MPKLSKETRRKDLEDIFKRYGKLTRCDIKYVNGKKKKKKNLLLLLLVNHLNI